MVLIASELHDYIFPGVIKNTPQLWDWSFYRLFWCWRKQLEMIEFKSFAQGKFSKWKLCAAEYNFFVS